MRLSATTFLHNTAFPGVLPQRGLHVVINAPIASGIYTILGQSHRELIYPDNSPGVSMWPYLLRSDQTRRFKNISVYTGRDSSGDQARLLYMNAGALRLWREMGMRIDIVGEINRPPRYAVLSFGRPFSE